MKKIGIFMADGCEEIEGLTAVDVLRRAGLEIVMFSLTDSLKVTGSHQITFLADEPIGGMDADALDGIILPGGMPGTQHLAENDAVTATVRRFAAEGKLVAAICAAPSVLGAAGVLKGKNATCHPGWEEKLTGAAWQEQNVVEDGNIITSRGMGTAVDFALAIVKYFADQAAVDKVKKGLVYQI